MLSAVEQHLQERAYNDMTPEHYRMPDNTNNKRMFTIWRIAAYIIGSVGVVAGVHTSNMIITAISMVIGTIILVSAKQRYRTGAFD